MKLSEAETVCINATTCDINTLTVDDIVLIEQAFAACVNLKLKLQSMFSGTLRVSEAVASEVVKSTDIIKSILALRNNKSVSKEQTLVTVLARIALNHLQNDGDCYEIEHDKFKIIFKMLERAKSEYDWEGIKVAAGASAHSEILNVELAKCFKTVSLSGNPSGADRAMQDGKLDSKYRTDKFCTDVTIEFNWKGE